MKITFDSGTIKEAYLKHVDKDTKAAQKNNKSAVPSKNDMVSISEDALALSESENKNIRIEKIKSSVENGTYKIDPKFIAEKFLSDLEPIE